MKQSSWALCAAAVLTGQMCLHLLTTQPLNRRIEVLTAEVAHLHAGIDRVAASASHASDANDLLADLTLQGKRVNEARSAIDQLRRFEREVRSQGHAAGHSLNLVRNISRLQDEIITQGQQIAQLEDSLDDLSAFQTQVHGLTSAAAREFVGVDRATQLVKGLGELKRDVATQAEDIELAVDNLHQLGELKQDISLQADGIEIAVEHLRGLGGLKQEVSVQAADIEVAVARLRKLGELKQDVAAQADGIEVAGSSLKRLGDLKLDISTQAMDVESAMNQLRQLGELKSQVAIESDGLELAETQFARLMELQESAASVPSEQIDIAQTRVAELTNLKQMIIDGGANLAAAFGLTEELVSLKENLINRGGRVDVARKHADGLLSLEDSLADDANLNIGHAQENLDALVAIERRLVSQEDQIISAVESLELMSDLQAEFAASVGGLDNIRRGLTELAMLESTVLRTVASLQPLMELTNLRRLNANDLQTIARGMMEQRASRVAASDSEFGPSSNSNDRFDAPVPFPPSDD